MNSKAIVRNSTAGSPAGTPNRRTALTGRRLSGPLAGLLVVGLGLFTSCSIPLPTAQPDLTRYYLLNSVPARPEAKAAAPAKRWVLGVRNVEIPSYLRNKSFAIRSHANEVSFLDLARWGEPLDQGVARVLVENLQLLPNVVRISTQPFRAEEQRDFDLLVQVSACEGTADGAVLCSATWRITAPTAAANTVAEGRFTAAGLHWDGRDCGQLAAKLSEGLASLSHNIGVALPAKEPEPAFPPAEPAFPPAEMPAKPAAEVAPAAPAKPANEVVAAKPDAGAVTPSPVAETAPAKPTAEVVPAKPDAGTSTPPPTVEAAPAKPTAEVVAAKPDAGPTAAPSSAPVSPPKAAVESRAEQPGAATAPAQPPAAPDQTPPPAVSTPAQSPAAPAPAVSTPAQPPASSAPAQPPTGSTPAPAAAAVGATQSSGSAK